MNRRGHGSSHTVKLARHRREQMLRWAPGRPRLVAQRRTSTTESGGVVLYRRTYKDPTLGTGANTCSQLPKDPMNTRFRFKVSVIVATLVTASALHAQAVSKDSDNAYQHTASTRIGADNTLAADKCDAMAGGAKAHCLSTARARLGRH